MPPTSDPDSPAGRHLCASLRLNSVVLSFFMVKTSKCTWTFHCISCFKLFDGECFKYLRVRNVPERCWWVKSCCAAEPFPSSSSSDTHTTSIQSGREVLSSPTCGSRCHTNHFGEIAACVLAACCHLTTSPPGHTSQQTSLGNPSRLRFVLLRHIRKLSEYLQAAACEEIMWEAGIASQFQISCVETIGKTSPMRFG